LSFEIFGRFEVLVDWDEFAFDITALQMLKNFESMKKIRATII
jgi:hypothetical protein